MTTNNLVARIWSFCDTLRDDGVSYSDYLEQLTFLLFLKMAEEYENGPQKRISGIPSDFNWQSLIDKKGIKLKDHYETLLGKLGQESGMLGQIFSKAQNKIQDPAKLERLVKMIGKESWVQMDTDTKGDMYEGLLEKNAQDTKSGAGQYFTPRDLIRAIVECVNPLPMKTIADPACGTGGFFLSAIEHIENNNKLTAKEREFLENETFYGWEIVPSTSRLCLMNLFLHNIGDLKSKPPIYCEDALKNEPKQKFDYVLANPPFGKKSSVTVRNSDEDDNEDLTYNRRDFWVTTTNKQLNFLQHIVSMLNSTGKAAVVVPDNVLFEGGVGEIVRKNLLEKTRLHTILRLPKNIFYALGVKANVLFFDNQPNKNKVTSKEIWFYDYRTNVNLTFKKNPLKYENLKGFIECFKAEDRSSCSEFWSENNQEGRWRNFTYEEVLARDKTSLDISWLRDENMLDLENLPEPEELINEIIEDIEKALASFKSINDTLS